MFSPDWSIGWLLQKKPPHADAGEGARSPASPIEEPPSATATIEKWARVEARGGIGDS
jgi:hypothetical protein